MKIYCHQEDTNLHTKADFADFGQLHFLYINNKDTHWLFVKNSSQANLDNWENSS